MLLSAHHHRKLRVGGLVGGWVGAYDNVMCTAVGHIQECFRRSQVGVRRDNLILQVQKLMGPA